MLKREPFRGDSWQAPIEALESRQLLAGVTVLTHGYESGGSFPDWVSAMRLAIESRAGTPSVDTRALHLEVDGDGSSSTLFDARGQGQFFQAGRAEAVMSVDWASASNNNVTPSFGTLVDTRLIAQNIFLSLFGVTSEVGNPAPLAELPIHLIGFDRGAGVMSELAWLLGQKGIWVDQVTTLDAHPLTAADPIRSGGEDPAMAFYANTLYLDNYYRTNDASWANPAGQSLTGAYNRLLDPILNLHPDVHAAYYGSINVTATTDGDGRVIDNNWYGGAPLGPRTASGFKYSRLGGGPTFLEGRLSQMGGVAVRSAAPTSGDQWPNVAGMTIASGATVRPSQPLTVPFAFGDRDSGATIHFFYDTDTNPYNGWVGQAAMVNMPQTAFVNSTVQITGTDIPTGAYYLMASVSDGQHTRYSYAQNLVTVLNGFDYEAVFPEGYAADHINEFVPITNTNGVPVTYELHARYETGDRDQLISSGTIAANTRGGVTIAETRNPAATIVRKNEPYALVLRSTLPLAATFSHYDFGTTIGESFTYQRSTQWTFADGVKDNVLGRDYILVYNPTGSVAPVTLELYTVEGLVYTDTRNVGAERRGGWSISDISELGLGAYSARVTSTAQIVAAQSRYQPGRARGYGALGSPEGGALAGVVPRINYEDTFYDENGDDQSGTRYTADAFVSVLNTNNAPATITLHFFVDKIGVNDPAPIPRVVIAPARGRTTLSIRDLGLPEGRQFGVVYRSNIAVTMSGSVYQGQDGTGVVAATYAATQWLFGEGYMDADRAGGQIIEDIYLFNPGASDLEVTITFTFTDGGTVTVLRTLDARELDDVSVDQLAEVTGRAREQWYGIKITAPTYFVAGMEHWDGGNGGGFQTLGSMFGSITNFAGVLTL